MSHLRFTPADLAKSIEIDPRCHKHGFLNLVVEFWPREGDLLYMYSRPGAAAAAARAIRPPPARIRSAGAARFTPAAGSGRWPAGSGRREGRRARGSAESAAAPSLRRVRAGRRPGA